MSFQRLEDCWIWPEPVERFFRSEAEGETLHVCCGSSDLGDVTFDRDPERNPDVVGDMMNLPFPDCSFDTVICDPPWNAIQAVGRKHKLLFELLRVVKADGLVLWNAYSLPESTQTELEGVWVRQDYEEGKASIIGKYRKFPGQQTLEASTARVSAIGGNEEP